MKQKLRKTPWIAALVVFAIVVYPVLFALEALSVIGSWAMDANDWIAREWVGDCFRFIRSHLTDHPT